jgi:hypothetical protein
VDGRRISNRDPGVRMACLKMPLRTPLWLRTRFDHNKR